MPRVRRTLGRQAAGPPPSRPLDDTTMLLRRDRQPHRLDRPLASGMTLEDARSFPILPYDDVAAETHGRERARLEEVGKTPPFVDGQIAAIAHCQGLTLVTANMDDFRYFEELELADWTR